MPCGNGRAAPLAVERIGIAHQFQPALAEEPSDLIDVNASTLAYLRQVGLGVVLQVGPHPLKGFSILPPAFWAYRSQPVVHQLAASAAVP